MTEDRATGVRAIVLVTGGSSGIGEACARHLAEQGCTVFAAARSLSEESFLDEVELHGLSTDVTDEASVARCVDRIVETAGRLDAIVNCAGFGIAGAIEATSIDEAKEQFDTNFFGTMRVCHAALPVLRRQRSGAIVNVSSIAGRIGLPFQGLYSATKFAIEGLTEALRMELKPFGIRVSLIEPGDFRTGFTASRRRVDGDLGGAYRLTTDRALAAAESDERSGASPERVARLLLRILRDPSPRLRYTVGPLSQRLSVAVKPLLPAGILEREVMRHYKVL